MRKLEDFFLKNLAYCAVVKHRNPAESVYSNMSYKINQDIIQGEINAVLQNKDGKRLIYLFFVDKQTKDNLQKIFNNFTFQDFFD